MTLWTKNELIEALSGELLEHKLLDNLEIDEVVIDSRKTPKSGLFLALKGEKNDAHNFLEQAVANGCKALLVQDKSALEKVKNSDFLLVRNSFDALYKLAEFSRKRSAAKIIAITGSVGKTSTKEMLKLAFAAYGKTFATYGNLNNHIGLPLSLCNFEKNCAFGIFEMGMNHLNEIEPLSRLARPHLAIITNVGPVHIEFFKDEEEIALAKSEIFAGLEKDGKILLNHDNKHFEFLRSRAEVLKIPQKNILSFGKDVNSNYSLRCCGIKAIDNSEIYATNKNGKDFYYKIASSNKVAVFNSLIAFAALDLLTKNASTGLLEFNKFKDQAGRGKASEIKIGKKTITIIDDSYNASVPSVKAGLEYASELRSALGKNRVVAALGDMLELGDKSAQLHKEAINFLKKMQIGFAILVGSEMTKASQGTLDRSCVTFADSSAAALEIKNLLEDGDILYVKGSRGIKMEKLLEKLTNKTNAH
jgi:UDP-N-acetylmuramoyl-tripeptide--D-alanyl-D-alanine ligase